MRTSCAIISLLLVYLMTPGAVEITENVAHVVVHGDAAHGDDHGQPESGDEHGCSGPYHFCACHHSVSFVATVTKPAVPENNAQAWCDQLPQLTANDSGYSARIERPPIA